ncbi:CobW family GTP-binding protein [Alloalcanivorax marinus]|uniref:CobW family GTP-binding protein n=1 Tax=Alloalcanivorax marinus TaxID=1177169 RepID=UPI001931C990|nr:CobW family GTP-binding protein [Alloalcanivorax marinus]MBL7250135.1 GTP-binding protein [Alloalcanivorax marinus]
MSAPTPLVVLTGFLGSGKTTLLNRWLGERGDLAVIINELGDIGIDQDLARKVGAPVSLLAGGCVCCAVQGTLRTTLRNLYMARAAGDLPAFSLVLLETTGAADPFGVVSVLEQDPWLRKRFSLRSILTTVDAVAGEAALARYPEALEQVTAADRLLLTKVDRVDGAARQALAEALARLNPDADVVDAAAVDATVLDRDFPRRCRITGVLAPLSGVMSASISPMAPSTTPAGRGHALQPAGLRWRGRIAYEQLQAALAALRAAAGDDLVRLKGLVAIEKLDGPLLIQAVGAQPLEMTPLPAWPGGDEDSRLVVITAGDDPAVPRKLLADWGRRLDMGSLDMGSLDMESATDSPVMDEDGG